MIVLSHPAFAFIELTAACNNHCPGCGNVFSHTESSLDAATWLRLLEALQPHLEHIKVTGGEPTLHPELNAILTGLDDMGLPFSLFTNARWSDPDKLMDLLSKTERCRGLLVSLHGARPASHEAFTGVSGSFDETIRNIRRAVSAGQNVTTSTVITAENWHEIEEIVILSRQLGANHAVFNRYLGMPVDALAPTADALRAAVRTVERLRREALLHQLPHVRFGNCIPQCWCPSSAVGCLAGLAYCTIDPWGNVRPCNHAPLVCGNLLDESLKAIWQGDAMQAWRRSLAEPCRECAELERCHGGCRALAMLRGEEKDPLMRSPLSKAAQRSPRVLKLYEKSRPICHCTIQAEDFGYVLLTANHVIPVASRAKPIMDACDGSHTLAELQQKFGQSALDFVGYLTRQGLVELAT
jgi:AdoMet-dependent heme synthase